MDYDNWINDFKQEFIIYLWVNDINYRQIYKVIYLFITMCAITIQCVYKWFDCVRGKSILPPNRIN